MLHSLNIKSILVPIQRCRHFGNTYSYLKHQKEKTFQFQYLVVKLYFILSLSVTNSILFLSILSQSWPRFIVSYFSSCSNNFLISGVISGTRPDFSMASGNLAGDAVAIQTLPPVLQTKISNRMKSKEFLMFLFQTYQVCLFS